MAEGTPVSRNWIVVLHNGVIAIDWGDGLYQDVMAGEFIKVNESEISHLATETELDWLVRIGRVVVYDSKEAHFRNLPERRMRTID